MWFFFNYHKNRPSRTLPEEGFGPLKITKQFKRHESGRLGRQLSFLVIFLIHMLFPRLGNIFNFSVSNLNPERAIQTWELTGDNLFGVAIYRWLASGFFCSLPARGLKGSHLLSPGLHKTTETKDFSIFFFLSINQVFLVVRFLKDIICFYSDNNGWNYITEQPFLFK